MTGNIKPSGSLISYFSNKVKQNGGINLAQGLPGFEPPLQLKKYLEAAASMSVHQYAPGYGLDALREYAANDLNSKNISHENILITNGGTEAISLLYLYLYKRHNKNLNVLSFSPVYESYSNLPSIYNNSFTDFFFKDDFGIDLELLEKTVIDKNINLIFLASPGNPLGKVFCKSDIEQIVSICKTHNVELVLDIVYKHLYYSDKPEYPFAALSPHVFFTDSFSKQFSITGWRLGYIVADSEIIQDISDIHDYIGLSSPHPLQYALSQFLTQESEEATNYKIWLKEQIGFNMKQSISILNKAGYSCADVWGGFFVWTKIPNKFSDGFDFANRLYSEKQVAVIPGEHFGDYWKNYIRINVAHPKELLFDALNKIVNL